MRPWEKAIRRVTPYVPGEQPKGGDLVKLNTNENPYPPSPAVLACLRDMDGGSLRKYPDNTRSSGGAGSPLWAGSGADFCGRGVG